ncbi:MAG TPA: cytochrome b [Stellaceae bacterium]|jgi:cytochrome b561|nr:cytochrome b [Stellaceae bacterium]
MIATTEANAGTVAGYSRISRLLHWLIVLLIIGVFGITYFWAGPSHRTLLQIHKSLGVTILVLMLMRLLHWAVVPRPKLLPAPGWQHAAARISHFLLYAAFIVQPALGWSNSMMTGKPVNYFLLGNLPSFLPQNKELADKLIAIHFALPNFIMALVALHICAALYHYIVIRDRTLQRMISGS